MDRHLVGLLQAANPWLTEPDSFKRAAAKHLPPHYLPRTVERAARWPAEGKAHLLVGARQGGKSSLLWHWFVQNNRPPLYLNAEEYLIRDWCTSPTLFVQQLADVSPTGMPLFIEEAQHLKDAGLFIKGLIDNRLERPLFVTGSSSFHLHAKTRES